MMSLPEADEMSKIVSKRIELAMQIADAVNTLRGKFHNLGLNQRGATMLACELLELHVREEDIVGEESKPPQRRAA